MLEQAQQGLDGWKSGCRAQAASCRAMAPTSMQSQTVRFWQPGHLGKISSFSNSISVAQHSLE